MENIIHLSPWGPGDTSYSEHKYNLEREQVIMGVEKVEQIASGKMLQRRKGTGLTSDQCPLPALGSHPHPVIFWE